MMVPGRLLALTVALAAGGALIVFGPRPDAAPPAPPGPLTVEAAWPDAKRADLTPDPSFTPRMFLDAATVIGLASDTEAERLVLRSGDQTRELRRAPRAGNPQFEAFTADADVVLWAESTDRDLRVRLWSAPRAGGPARLLTDNTGNVVFTGTQHDIVIADGRAHWAAAPASGAAATEIRSVPLAGGKVSVRTEPGQWSLTTWPWLADETEGRLRDLTARRDVRVAASGAEQASCSPAWCRVTVMGGGGIARLDMMRPDGSDRRRVAGADARAAVFDVAVLDRFEILAMSGPDTDLTGAAKLVLYDLVGSRTVEVSPAADGAFTRGGMLWWSTTDEENAVGWHALDLRTVP